MATQFNDQFVLPCGTSNDTLSDTESPDSKLHFLLCNALLVERPSRVSFPAPGYGLGRTVNGSWKIGCSEGVAVSKWIRPDGV